MKDIIENKLCVEAGAGSKVAACIRESVVLAFEKDVTVVLTHNNVDFIISPGEIIDNIFHSVR